MRPDTRLATLAAAAVTVLGGVACGTGDGGGASPGQQEAPAGDTGGTEDDGAY